ncbi:MAG: tetratricopeptide repeat protein [Myxococcales bacterium]|nr:MAG: tetratricopeptide repeat protein [Myxococcales bacterium]
MKPAPLLRAAAVATLSLTASTAAGLPTACKVPNNLQVSKPRIVVADFAGDAQATGAKVATDMSSELATSLATAKNDVEMARANCVISSGADARALAIAWKARLVVWGQVSRDQPNTPEAVSTRITLGPIGARSSGNRSELDVGSLDEFQLPTMRGNLAHLSKLALGVQFLDRPDLALKFFESAASALPIDPKTGLAPLYRAMGSSYLSAPGGPEKLLRIAQDALKANQVRGTRAESELLTLTGVALAQKNRLDEALYNLNAALALDLKLQGKDSERVADDLDNLAGVLARKGDADGAARAAEQSIAILTKLYGPHDPRLAGPLTRLGVIFTEHGAYAEGLAPLERALAIDRQASIAWRIPEGLNNVAWNLAGQQQYAAAITKYREALTLGASVYPANHPWPATCKGNLAWALSGTGKQDEAIALLRQTIPALTTPDGAEDDVLAAQYEHLGSAHIQKQEFTEARAAYAKAQSLNERVFGSEHPTTLWVQRKYARSIAATSGWRQGQSAGAVVWKVQPKTAAARLGLRMGDWIIEYGSVAQSEQHLQQLAMQQPAGQRVVFMRDGKQLSKVSESGLTGALLYTQGQ